MRSLVKIVSATMIVIAGVILAYAVLTPQEGTGTDHMGMWGHSSYSSANVGLIALSTVMIVAAIMILLLREEYQPLPPMAAPPAQHPVSAVREEVPEARETVSQNQVVEPSSDDTAAKEYLILRLLTGDERTMFKAVMDSGGEALQKDLIVRTKMSNAKVSRLLDKLEQKGVVTKERYGSTNRIRLRTE